MSQAPIIVPLLLTGILVGYILRYQKKHIGLRFMVLGSLLGGLGNMINAAILQVFQERSTMANDIQSFDPTRFSGSFDPTNFPGRETMLSQTPAYFLIISFVIGVLIVLLVLVPASFIQRRTFRSQSLRGGKSEP